MVRIPVIIGALAALTLFLLGLAAVAQAQSAPAAYQVYVPLIRAAGAAQEPPPSPPQSGALLLGDASYRSAGIAVDRQGGMHAVFIRVAPFAAENEPAPVYYASCSPSTTVNCAQRHTWQLTPLEPQGYTHAQIELTSDGRPRLLLIGQTDAGGGFLPGHLYRYGECDAQCATAANWRFTTVLVANSGGGLHETDYTYRTFALDHLGRPRFIYEDRAERTDPALRGAWYVFCNADCTAHSSSTPAWLQTRIDSEQLPTYITERAVLAFSSTGQPRVFAQDGGSFSDLESKLVYLECAAACEQSVNWLRSEPIIGTGSGTAVYGWSAALDAAGRPRLVIYPRGGPFIYAWCDVACTAAGNWSGGTLDFGQGSGASAALALDAQGRPRIAYRDGVADVGYAWCDTNCESGQARWNTVQVEAGNAIARDRDVPLLPTCVRGGWFGGMRITLALDPAGNPRIGYDAEFRMECKRYPDDPNNTLTFVETKWWTSRFAFFAQPN